MKEVNIEITKEDITLAAFITLCKAACKAKDISFTFDKDKFIQGSGQYCHYYNDETRSPVSYVHVERPYTYIDYKRNSDNTTSIEIYSFEFNEDNKKGTGYFKYCIRNS